MFLSHSVCPELLFQNSLAILQRLIMVFLLLLKCRCPVDNTLHCHQIFHLDKEYSLGTHLSPLVFW